MSANEDRARELMREFCGELDVTPIDNGAFVLSTPFYYGDGDGFLIELEPVETGWRLTDHGDAASHLFFEDVELTPSRLEFIQRAAQRDGISVSPNYALTSGTFDDFPTVDDLASFVQAMARVSAVVALERHPQERYISTVRTEVIRWLPPIIAATHPFHHHRDLNRTYAADLYMRRDGDGRFLGTPLAMFFVAGDLKASNSALAAAAFKRWTVADELLPIAAYRPGLIAPSLNKLIDNFGRENVYETPMENPSSLREVIARNLSADLSN